MIINLDVQEMIALLKDFYLLTGIRISVFDVNNAEIAAYPQSSCAYCKLFQSDPVCFKKCYESNRQSFLLCQKTSKINVYHCHAGLVEVTVPLIDNGILIGYMMFGQITDLENDDELLHLVDDRLTSYHFTPENSKILCSSIIQKSIDQIHAAARIMEACTFYVLLKHLISARQQNFRTNLDNYLAEHIREDITSEKLAFILGISRSKLYESSKNFLGCGIATYLKIFRLEQAKQLLKETNQSVTEISEQVGFSDYNYFCRVFKAYAGIPAKKFRNMNHV